MTDESKTHPHELISALLDGEATVPERAAVDRHLRDCAECRALLGDYRTLATAAAASQPPPVPAGLLAAVRARLEAAGGRAEREPAPPRPWWTSLWRSPLPAAAVAGVLFAGVTLWMLRERTPPALHAPPVEGIEDEIGADRVVPGKAESVMAGTEAKKDAPFRESARSPVAAAPPPDARIAREQTPPPPAETGRTAGLLEQEKAAGSVVASRQASGSADLAQTPDRKEADARQQMAASPPAKAAQLAAAGVRAGEGRELRFELPGYSGTITEGGMIAIQEGEFRCTARVGDSPEIRAEIASLFSLASSSEAPGAGQGMPAAGMLGQAGEPGRVASRISVSVPGRDPARPGPSHELPPASAGEIGRRIDGLIQGPLRDTLKDQCGRLPGAGGREPAD